MTVRFALRVPEPLYRRLVEQARLEGRSVNEAIVGHLNYSLGTGPVPIEPVQVPGQERLLDLDAADEDD